MKTYLVLLIIPAILSDIKASSLFPNEVSIIGARVVAPIWRNTQVKHRLFDQALTIIPRTIIPVSHIRYLSTASLRTSTVSKLPFSGIFMHGLTPMRSTVSAFPVFSFRGFSSSSGDAFKPEIAVVNQENLGSLLNLAQAYEAEFSSLTGKMPSHDGIFKFDTMPFNPYVGYIFYYDNLPIGFCVLNPESNPKDISEYYIVPVMRRKNLGYLFAQAIFSTYPGQWQVRQIQGADQAVKFWRRLISQYTQNQYVEERVNDPEWGLVTRQLFVSKDAGGVKPLAVSHK